jgi:tRNA dimethylallyltransferase
VRADVERQLGEVGPVVLHQRLQQLDPVAAAKIEPGNARRTVRALEVTLGSGRPFSSFGPGLDTYPPSRHRLIGLRWDREVLARRIAERVQRMLDAGWLDEVARLRAEGEWSRTAAAALGYRQLVDHLDGVLSLDDAVAEIVRRTRAYAVRQERWFRRDPRLRWVDISHDPVLEALPVLEST